MFSMIADTIAFIADIVIILFLGSSLIYEAIRVTRERGTVDDDEDAPPYDVGDGSDVEEIFPLRYPTDEDSEETDEKN